MPYHRLSSVIVIGAAVTLLGASLALAQSSANIGTLTCTVDPGTKTPVGVERDLSCTFEPIIGAKADLTGVVKRLGAEIAGQEKIVLAWSVLGPSADTPAKQLEGRYLGKLDTKGTEDDVVGLIGGADAKIILRPLTESPQLGTNAAISVLELELKAMKA